MFSKSVAVFLFAAYFATFANAFGDSIWSGLSVTWPIIGNSGPYSLPLTLQDAIDDGWTTIEGAGPSADTIDALNLNDGLIPETFNILYSAGYKNNSRYVMHFNQRGEPVGFQVGFPAADVANTGIDYVNNHPGIIPKTLNGVEYLTASFFVAIDATGNRRVWLVDLDGPTEIATTATELKSETAFLEKNCVPTMGTHYYQLNSTSDCSVFNPFVPLLNGEDLIGVAIQAIGSTTVDSTRTWNENIPYYGVTVACSDAPTCFTEEVKEYGIISIHTWMVPTPMNIACS